LNFIDNNLINNPHSIRKNTQTESFNIHIPSHLIEWIITYLNDIEYRNALLINKKLNYLLSSIIFKEVKSFSDNTAIQRFTEGDYRQLNLFDYIISDALINVIIKFEVRFKGFDQIIQSSSWVALKFISNMSNETKEFTLSTIDDYEAMPNICINANSRPDIFNYFKGSYNAVKITVRSMCSEVDSYFKSISIEFKNYKINRI
jgi:hypothetical protein